MLGCLLRNTPAAPEMAWMVSTGYYLKPARPNDARCHDLGEGGGPAHSVMRICDCWKMVSPPPSSLTEDACFSFSFLDTANAESIRFWLPVGSAFPPNRYPDESCGTGKACQETPRMAHKMSGNVPATWGWPRAIEGRLGECGVVMCGENVCMGITSAVDLVRSVERTPFPLFYVVYPSTPGKSSGREANQTPGL